MTFQNLTFKKPYKIPIKTFKSQKAKNQKNSLNIT